MTTQFRNVAVLLIMLLQAAFHTFILYVVFDRLHHQTSFHSSVIAIKRSDAITKLFYILQKYYLKNSYFSPKLPPQNPKMCPPPAPGSVAPSDVSVVRISAKLFRLVQTSKCVRTNTELVSKPCTFPFDENSGPASDRI